MMPAYCQMMSAKCTACGGNDNDAPCAYPGEGLPGCLRERRLHDTLTLAGHAEIWARLLGYSVPPRDSWEWRVLYEAWAEWTFNFNQLEKRDESHTSAKKSTAARI